MPIDFSDITSKYGGTPQSSIPPSSTGGGLDFSDILSKYNGQQSPSQPQAPQQNPQDIIAGGIHAAPNRTVSGQTYDTSNSNLPTKIVGGIGNFLLGSAPDILSRNIMSNQMDQQKQKIISDAQSQMALIQNSIQAAQSRGNTASVQRLTNTLADYIQHTNDLLGEDVFQKPTALQTAGAVGTVAANLIPALGVGSDLFRGAKIGTQLGENILGNTVPTGIMRAAPSLLQRSGQMAAEGGLFLGSQKAAETGDVGETLKSTALGAGVGALTPGALALGGKALAPVAEKFANPLEAKTQLGRKFFELVSPVKNIIQSVGEKGKALYNTLENIKINRDLYSANAHSALGEFEKVYAPLSQAQKDEFYNITSQNTAANPIVKQRGLMFDAQELAAKTTDPKVQEAILKAEPITRQISEAQKGRLFKGGAYEPVNRATGEVLPSTKNLEKIPSDLRAIGERSQQLQNPDLLVKEMNDIQNKVTDSGISSLTPQEKALYDADNKIAGGTKISRNDVINNIFDTAKSGTLDETAGGVYSRRSIRRVAESPSIFFPTSLSEKGAKMAPDVEDRINDLLANNKEVKAIAATDPEYARTVARDKAEAEIENAPGGPGAGKAKESFFGNAEQARGNNIETDALKAYRQYVERESNKAAQLQELGGQNITGNPHATSDEIAQAQLDKMHGEIRQELETKFGKDSQEAKDVSDLIKKQTGIFLNGPDTANKWLSGMKKFEMLKMGLSFLPHMFQTLNTALASDLPSLSYGLKSAFTSWGQDFAEKAGAKEGTMLAGEANSLTSKFMKVYLSPLRYTAQNFNRVVSANTASRLAEGLAEVANKVDTPEAVKALEQLEELTGKTFERGKLVELTTNDLYRAANKLTRATQFGANSLELPFWANSPIGSTMFQFKSYAYNQVKLLASQTIGELQAGNPGRAARNFGIIATAFPMTGEVVNSLKAIITGKPDNSDFTTIDGYLNLIASTAGLGIANDIIRQSGSNISGATTFIAGPAAGTVSEAAYRGIKGVQGLMNGDVNIPLEELYKLGKGQFGGIGSGVANVLGLP